MMTTLLKPSAGQVLLNGLRSALLGVSHLGLSLDLAFLSIGVVVLTAIGSFLFSKIEV